MLHNGTISLKITTSKFISNTGWLIASRVLQAIFSLIVNMIAARYLGPSNYGTINYVSSFVAFASTISILGLDAIIVKEIIDRPDKQGATLGSAIGLRIISSIISMNCVIFIIGLLNPKDPIIIKIAILEVISLLFGSFDIIMYYYQALLKSKYIAIISLIAYACMSIYRVILIVLKSSIEAFAFAFSVDTIVSAILFCILYYRQKGPKLVFYLDRAKELLKSSYHFIISGLMVNIFSKMDKIMLGNMISQDSVGIYTSAVTICVSWTFILRAIVETARPIIFESRKNSTELYERRITQLYALIIWISIALAVVISIFAKWIVYILYGSQYLNAVAPLRIVVWYVAFSLHLIRVSKM
jgi:O-antigen/teichoic acid export membrane protein